MVIGNIVRQTGRLALAAAVVAGVTLALDKPAQAISGGEAAATSSVTWSNSNSVLA